MDYRQMYQEAEQAIQDLKDEVDNLRLELEARDRDELTGLHNLRWLRNFWNMEGSTIGHVAFIDVNGLKPVNDTYGHKVGDRLLIHVATALAASGAYAVRYGGDEFLLLIPSRWDQGRTINGILEILHSEKINVQDGVIAASVSIGVTPLKPGMLLRHAIEKADEAMYAMKRRRAPGSGVMFTS